MKNQRNVCYRFLLLLICALGYGVNVCGQSSSNKDFKTPQGKLQLAEMLVKNLYVDSVNEPQLVENAIRGMLEKLDPHSTYSTAQEAKAMNESLNGAFDGIGIQFNLNHDTLIVMQPITNGPSEKVGILPGDRIITANDTAISGVKMTRENIIKRLRGPRGSKVRLGIIRPGIPEMLYFNVVRDQIPLKTLDAYYMIAPHVGYIRIGSFGATTYDEFMAAVKALQAQGMRDMILDLQSNGGGYLHAAVGIANEFLGKNDLIVYTEGRKVPRSEFRAKGDGRLQNGRLVVLVNELSASAAEIVTGAMQDQDRAIVVGRRSFGKGLVQRPILFPDGSMMRLTIAHYYTPSGRCIQKPYTKGERKDYYNDLELRMKHGEFMSADSIHLADSLKYYTVHKNKLVYGGGGIMPDVFVPLDTTVMTPYYRKMAAKSIILNGVVQYVDANRKNLKKQYTDFNAYNKHYEVPQSLIDSIIADAKKQKIVPKDKKELAATLPFLKLQVKALIARDILDVSDYFHIINQRSDVVNKALEVLKAK